MSNVGEDVHLSLKVMINKEKTKVLFAEADSNFADVLLSLLTLPLGRIAKILEKHYTDKAPAFGSITSLFKGLANLDDLYFSTTVAKLMLLDSRSCSDSICRNLKIDISESLATKYFTCEFAGKCGKYSYENVCMYYGGTARCDCGTPLNCETLIGDSEDAGGFTISRASFIISDDLKMVPYSIETGFFQTLTNLGVTAAEGAELRNVTLGTDEIMDLLKCSLLSKTPLTDLVLNKRKVVSLPEKSEPGYFLHKIDNEETGNCKKIILKVMVHKSTSKVLFAQAEDDFIDLLCSFLIIPIGGVESLLDSNSCLKNLDNLYRSVSDITLDKFFLTLDTKKRLTNPSIPPFYKSKNTILPLMEESPREVYLSYKYINKLTQPTISHIYTGFEQRVTSFKSPKGDENYVLGPITFMVTDDLIVTPFCMSACLSIINRMNILLSDVEELEVHIGLQEGLSILKASLTSTSALTNGLINHIMKKQPKKEH